MSLVDDDMQDVLHDVSFEDAPFLDEVVQDVPVAVPFKDVPPDAPLDGDIMQDVPVDDVNGIQNAPVDVSLKRTEQALQEPSLHSSSALQQATDGSQSDAKDTSSSVPVSIVYNNDETPYLLAFVGPSPSLSSS